VDDKRSPRKLQLRLSGTHGKTFLAFTFRPLWLWVLTFLVLAVLVVETVAVVSYINAIQRIRTYTQVLVEVQDLRRQNAQLMELDTELRDLLAYQQKMLRLAGIETALRKDPRGGDNFLEGEEPDSAGAFVDFLLPVMGGPVRWFDESHPGVDLEAGLKWAVVAVSDGVVTETRSDPKMGFRMTVAHNDSLETVYANNHGLLVAVGDSVSTGQAIALVGSGFENDTPHLHFEVWVKGKPVSPEGYLPGLTPMDEMDSGDAKENGRTRQGGR